MLAQKGHVGSSHVSKYAFPNRRGGAVRRPPAPLRIDISIASIIIPLVAKRGEVPSGDLRVLVGAEEPGNYTILAARLEFPTGLLWVPASEQSMAGGDVVVSYRNGYVEEVLVNDMSQRVIAMLNSRVSGPSPVARHALECIRGVWQRLAKTPGLTESLLNRESRAADPDWNSWVAHTAWDVDIEGVQASWIAS